MRTPRDLITANLELIALPELVMKLSQMVDDPRCSANDIANVILQDAALSAHLLRIANSPFYSLPSKVDSVSLAITIIGTRQLRDMILATTVVNHFNSVPDNLIPINTFWQHNIACASASSIIAKRMNSRHHEHYFLAGLLHDIGKLVMCIAEPELSRETHNQAETSENNLHEIEQGVFGFTHNEVGAELLRQWNFPESLIEPVLHHHNPGKAKQYLPETAAVHLANAIANTLMPSLSRDDDLPIDPNVWEYLGIQETMLESLLAETKVNIDHAFDLLYNQQAA
jgi:putative nucleotidyltransferase with HDIG domain